MVLVVRVFWANPEVPVSNPEVPDLPRKLESGYDLPNYRILSLKIIPVLNPRSLFYFSQIIQMMKGLF